MDQQEYANFKVWAEQWYDFSDPAQVRLFEEAFPDYYQQRAQLIKNLGDNATKFAILRLLGPRTRDDFMFMWLVTSGKIPLPQGPLWDPKKWADEGPPLQLALFNPWKMMNADEEPVRVDVNNRTDPVGLGFTDGIQAKGGNYGGLPAANALSYYPQYNLSVGQTRIPKLNYPARTASNTSANGYNSTRA